MIARALAALGRIVLARLAGLGRFGIFLARLAKRMLSTPVYPGEVARQALQIGWLSLPVVGLTALFTGAALALQIYAGGERFSAESVVPSIVAIGMARELGPVLVGLMVAARVGSSIAAEIGTMKVTEQIDALVTLSTDPLRYLAVPRIIAATLCLPVLVAVGDLIGVMGGWLIGVNRLGFNSAGYLKTSWDFLEYWDVASGLWKGATFGLIVALAGVWFGLHSGRGAQGVGRATKSAVVAASVAILASNYLLTDLFFGR